MEKHSSNPISYIVEIRKDQLQSLSQIRHFNNLKVAFKESAIWIKDFSMEQIESVALNTLPFKSIYYINNNLLFPKDSLLPKSKLPSMLLWSPIEQALKLELPKMNHNYFGIDDGVTPKIVPSKEEKETIAILTPVDFNSKKVIESAANYRLKKLKYTIINDDALLIIGTPLLPIQGKSYWLQDDFLFPSGYSLEYPIVNASIKKRINPLGIYYVLWNENSNYLLISKTDCVPLSISSFRLSLPKSIL